MIKQFKNQTPEIQGLILYVTLNSITIALVAAIMLLNF